MPPLRPPGPDALSVVDFGATPDDDGDDTGPIQQALDRLTPGQWLVFPPGRYLHNRSLRVTVAGARLWGEGARLHATNPDDQAIMLMADGAGIYGFTLTAAAVTRGSQPRQARVAVFPPSADTPPLAGNEIRGNRIVADPAADARAANSATAAGIFVFRARGFLVADNHVERTLADGIHVTAGSSSGRIVNNTVRETGDDMVGIVSYLGRRGESAETIAADLDTRLAHALVRDIVVEGNDLAGQYWGRGIAVVGARDVTVRANLVSDTTMAAAIYVSREAGWRTAGAHNIVIEGNTVRRVQTTTPRYVAASAPGARRRTGHAAIEVTARIGADEARLPALAEHLRIRGVRIEDNVVDDAAGDGIRVGAPGTGGAVGEISLLGNRIGAVRGQPLRVQGAAAHIACKGNSHDGRPAASAGCDAPIERATGASLACLRAALPKSR